MSPIDRVMCSTRGCEDVLFLLVGKSNNLNETRIPVYMSETPAGMDRHECSHCMPPNRRHTA